MLKEEVSKNGAKAEGGQVQKNSFFTTLVVSSDFSKDELLEDFLMKEGHSVLKASSVSDAVALTRRFQPDLIFLDSDIVGKVGLALLPELLIEQVSAAIIILASKGDVTEAVEAMKRGAVDYFERPLDTQKLKKAIDIQKALFTSAALLGNV